MKIAFKSIYPIIMSLVLSVFTAVSAGAADDADHYDKVELLNGEKITGTLLTDSFTVTTPYSVVPLGKDKISEIEINPEGKDHDVILLNEGGLLEGTIEEPVFTLKLISGETVSLEKAKCKKIILKTKNE